MICWLYVGLLGEQGTAAATAGRSDRALPNVTLAQNVWSAQIQIYATLRGYSTTHPEPCAATCLRRSSSLPSSAYMTCAVASHSEDAVAAHALDVVVIVRSPGYRHRSGSRPSSYICTGRFG